MRAVRHPRAAELERNSCEAPRTLEEDRQVVAEQICRDEVLVAIPIEVGRGDGKGKMRHPGAAECERLGQPQRVLRAGERFTYGA